MDKIESIARAENLLKSRKYTEFERNRIIDLTNERWGTVFDKSRGKFQEEFTIHQFGIILSRSYNDVVNRSEEEQYAV
ncbi:hypothetical protein KIT04_108 [Vibrio phage KIT04]|nr:hypothetical protein KIT04_108 [Vibrio phage KIT04]